VLFGGLAVFRIASFMISQTETLREFNNWRFVQALGAAGGVGIIPMVQDRFGDKKSAKVISYPIITTIVGAVVAPLTGGVTLSYAGWPAIFLILAFLVAIAATAGTLFICEPAFAPSQLSFTQIRRGYVFVSSNRHILTALLTGAFAIAGLFAFIAINAIVTAMMVSPAQNGTVSANSGSAGFALGEASSAIVGYWPSVDAVPVTADIAACGIGATLCAIGLSRTQAATPPPRSNQEGEAT
jgi:MFS family permease